MAKRLHPKAPTGMMRYLVKVAHKNADSVCWICAKPFDPKHPSFRGNADHVLTWHIQSPLAVAHASCNARRAGRQLGAAPLIRLLHSPLVVRFPYDKLTFRTLLMKLTECHDLAKLDKRIAELPSGNMRIEGRINNTIDFKEQQNI